MAVYHLTPHIVQKIWGGDLLARKNGPNHSLTPIGETWEVSTLEEGPSQVDGRPLRDMVGELSFLVKFIQTTDHLSVQVHPDDIWAKKLEGSRGKTECWLILESESDAGVYLGVRPGVSRDSFLEGLNQGKDLSTFLNYFPVKKGDFFFVPAGTIHAIGKGICLLEIQQSSGITYRLWDWNRTDDSGRPRELHKEKAMMVANFFESFNKKENFLLNSISLGPGQDKFIFEHDFFDLELLSSPPRQDIVIENALNFALINLGDSITLAQSGESSKLEKWNSCFVVNHSQQALRIEGHDGVLCLKVSQKA